MPLEITKAGATPREGCFKDGQRWTASCMAKNSSWGAKWS